MYPGVFFACFFIYLILVHTIWPVASFRCQPVTFFFRTCILNNNRRIIKQCQWVHLNSNSKMKRKGNTYESGVSPVSKRYMRAGIGNDRLVVCLSEYLPLRIVYRIRHG